DTNLVHIAVGDGAVRPGKIDVFEDAERAALVLWKCLHTGHALFINHYDFTRFDVADKLGMYEVKGARFAGKHPAIPDSSKAKRPKAKRIADTDQFRFGHYGERIRAFDTADGLDQTVPMAVLARLGHQVQDDFAIDRGLEN